MLDPVAATLALVEAFERDDVAAAERLFHPERLADLRELYRWTVEDYIRLDWHPALEERTGVPRRVIATERVTQTGADPDTWPVRLTFEGPKGRAYFTLRGFDENGVGSFGVGGDIRDGIQSIYIHCPQAQREEVAAFYAAVLGTTVGPRGTRLRTRYLPSLAIAATRPGEPMPKWPDPSLPQQMHLDVTVPDVDAAARLAVVNGASVLANYDTHRVLADPAGHPLCLWPGESDVPALARLVIDGPDPEELAAFYAALLDMPERVESSPDRVVISDRDHRLPMLGFQRVAGHMPPTWGDPRSPQQFHFDLRFDDAPASADRLARLDATLLEPLGGTCPVYADPAGHPFCFCSAD